MTLLTIVLLTIFVILISLAIFDFYQRKHTIRAIYPLVGRIRWLLEDMGPKIHQYFVESWNDGKPFSKDQRAWVHASSKKEQNTTGFGSKSDFDANGHFFIKPALFPKPFDMQSCELIQLPCTKVIGLYNKRKKPYHPKSIINISGMSYGALSPTAVDAMNWGAKIAGCYQTTGEGGLSPYHKSGADVVFQFGTGYNGCRNPDGTFSLDRLYFLTKENPFIKMVEIKLHQGAKPGAWSILPRAKMTDEIRQVRGLEPDEDSISPGYHTAFTNVSELLTLIETIADKTGLPVGIKCGVGQLEQWRELALAMSNSGKGPDYIIIDGGEGGTGSAKASMVDHMGLPFVQAFSTVYQIFQKQGIEERVVWIGSGKLGFPAEVIKAMAMGCDMINVARTMMLSLGCIMSGLCHTDNCPSGVATQKAWRYKKLDPTLKSHRAANYIMEFRKNILEMTAAAGYDHPAQFQTDDIMVNSGDSSSLIPLSKIIGYHKMQTGIYKQENI